MRRSNMIIVQVQTYCYILGDRIIQKILCAHMIIWGRHLGSVCVQHGVVRPWMTVTAFPDVQ